MKGERITLLKKIQNYQKNAVLLVLLLIVLVLGSLLWLKDAAVRAESHRRLANIYQNGTLIRSIPLNEVSDPYTFTVLGENNCHNEIEVRQGSIGIISADCPDKLCVQQGFIDSSLLPITCLPNHLVIQITEEDTGTDASDMDIVTY